MSSDNMSVSAGAGASSPSVQVATQPKAQPSAAPQAAPKADVSVPKKPELSFNAEEKSRVLKEAIAEMNRQMEAQGRNLGFAIDTVANRTVITVQSRTTGEVVRQIPDESVLRVAHNIEAMRGLMLDEKA